MFKNKILLITSGTGTFGNITIISDEIAMICQSPPDIIITSWRFHLANEKQIIIK
jgi:FlaA1/EpsC-like NDP-sugar epimerase